MIKKKFSHAEYMFELYLELHSKTWAQLKMLNVTTEQNDLDYFEFCTKLDEVFKKYGFNFYRKIDEEVPNNTWLPLFREHVKIISSEWSTVLFDKKIAQ